MLRLAFQAGNKKVYLPHLDSSRSGTNRRGFSIVESIIGIFIVASVFTTFLAILPQAIKTESHAQRTIIATSLAQEGIEMVRNLRDNNLKLGNDAFTIYSSGGLFPAYDPFNNSFNIGAGVYGFQSAIYLPYTAGGIDYTDDTYFPGFTRTVGLKAVDESVEVTSTVTYDTEEMAKITATLYNWGQKK